MSKKLIIALMSVIVLYPGQLLAATSPSNLDPQQNGVTSDKSPKLSWNYDGTCPNENSCFRVEVSQQEDFQNIHKSTYTNNTYYSPSLFEGVWYWRVKAKDDSDNWSEYSKSSFRIEATEASTTFSNSSTPPSNSPSPSISPTPQQIKPAAEFNIDSTEKVFTNDTISKIEIKLTKLNENATYFLKAAFYKEGKTNYFGKTNINGNWVKNNTSFSEQFKITADNEGNWIGNIQAMIDTEDSGFEETGDYLLKVGRYNASGTGLTWSNSITVRINATKPPTGDKKTDAQKNATTSEINENNSNNIQPSIVSEKGILGTTSTSPSFSPSDKHELPNLTDEKKENQKTSSPPPTLINSEQRINWWFIFSGVIMFTLMGISIVHTNKKRYYKPSL